MSASTENHVFIVMGKNVVDFGDGSRVKSNMVESTGLPIDVINRIVAEVVRRLATRQQPVLQTDVLAMVHVVMIEMGYKKEAEQHVAFIKKRWAARKAPAQKISFIKCEYCGTTNDVAAERCVSCGAGLDKTKAQSKVI